MGVNEAVKSSRVCVGWAREGMGELYFNCTGTWKE